MPDGLWLDSPSRDSNPNRVVSSFVSGDGTLVPASRDITSADNGLQLLPAASVVLTIPANLSPKPSFIVDCPATGTISIAVSGGATSNGGTLALTRARASNPVGFVVLAHIAANDYGVSGT